MVIFVTGPSGVGKSYLTQLYYKSKNISPILSINTRQVKEWENEPNRYISENRFHDLLDAGDLCFVAINHGYYYGYFTKDVSNDYTVKLIELDSITAIKGECNYLSKIVRVIPSKGLLGVAIYNIYKKSDYVDIRITDFHEQINEEFLTKRRIKGDIIFENRFNKESEYDFFQLIDSLVNSNTKENK